MTSRRPAPADQPKRETAPRPPIHPALAQLAGLYVPERDPERDPTPRPSS